MERWCWWWSVRFAMTESRTECTQISSYEDPARSGNKLTRRLLTAPTNLLSRSLMHSEREMLFPSPRCLSARERVCVCAREHVRACVRVCDCVCARACNAHSLAHVCLLH